ncbi:MAG TPA: HisA/HisF-related TIM barrel protein [Vicinamibacterales bacterium]|nr:HisA/HisF-related TIM barrel protein [Vicinamibacterales bacterium]
MRIIGVIDLREGRAVHARAGRRDLYRPVEDVAGAAIEPGDAVALARAYVDQLGVPELYIADLDALSGGPPQGHVAAISAIGAPLLLDCAASSVQRARDARSIGAAQVVVALETLPGFDVLGDIRHAIGGAHVAFSLDLRDGQPIVAAGSRICASDRPDRLAERATASGAGSVIVIDLSRVGTGSGLDLQLLARVRQATDGIELLAGGGVRDADDLWRLADAGCDGALVASALHDGRIAAGDVAAALRYRSLSR